MKIGVGMSNLKMYMKKFRMTPAKDKDLYLLGLYGSSSVFDP